MLNLCVLWHDSLSEKWATNFVKPSLLLEVGKRRMRYLNKSYVSIFWNAFWTFYVLVRTWFNLFTHINGSFLTLKFLKLILVSCNTQTKIYQVFLEFRGCEPTPDAFLRYNGLLPSIADWCRFCTYLTVKFIDITCIYVQDFELLCGESIAVNPL